jgi:phosphoglycerate dehydrogenase-like enzyme
MPRVLILEPDAERYARLVRAASLPGLPDDAVDAAASPEGLDPAGYDVLFGAPDLLAEVLPRAVDARWVQSTWAGARPLVEAEPPHPGLVVTGVKGVFGDAMTEYVFGYLLAIHQRVLERAAAQREDAWRKLAPRRLAGKVLGVMGTGDIGGRIAAMGQHFGMRVRGLTRSGRATGVHDAYATTDRLAFAEGLDVLVGVLPDTQETSGIVDGAMLERLSPGAIFVNVGRGATVDEDALVTALRRGRPAWAVLDVFAEEPLPPAHPLWGLDNVYLTAHVAAQSHPEEITPVFADNWRRWIRGEPLVHAIDLARGY